MKKAILSRMFQWLGINWLARYLTRNKLVIFMLHGVAAPTIHDKWQPTWQRTSPEQLELIVKAYQKHFTFISLEHAVAMLQGEVQWVKNAAVLTFDDGYKNNLTKALPVLENLQVPMIVYPTLSAVEQRKPYWIDRLDFALQQLDKSCVELPCGADSKTINLRSRKELSFSYQAYRLALKGAYQNDYQMLADLDKNCSMLESESGASLEQVLDGDVWSDLLQKDDLQVQNPLLDFGSHTVSHIRVTHVCTSELIKELAQSKETLGKYMGRECKHFCYPNGDASRNTASLVQQCGYNSAVTTQQGLNKLGDNLFLLRRLPFPHHAKNPLEALFHLSTKLLRFRSN
ncbi:polysaccharide deacetylase family protein [Aurantivibrio plasticivorans]